jgi:putative tryptophan/tyrosine transport system substrate-binding protein
MTEQKTIGYLNSASPGTLTEFEAAFVQGLKEGGFVQGSGLAIERKWADGDFARLTPHAADLLKRPLDVLVTAGGAVAALQAKKAKPKVPILFISGYNPREVGWSATSVGQTRTRRV